MGTQHANDRAPFQVADVVEDLVNLKGVPHGDFNWMRGPERIEMECLLYAFSLQ